MVTAPTSPHALKERMVYLYCYVALFALVWGTGIVLYHGHLILLWIFLPTTAISAMLPLFIKRTGRVWLASHAVIVTTLTCAFVVDFVTLGTGSGTMMFGLYIPALAALMISPLAGFGYAFISLVHLGVMYLMQSLNVTALLPLGLEYAFLDVMRNAPPAMITLTGLAIAHEILQRRTLDTLKRTQDQLRSSERRYRAVSNLTSDYSYYFRFEPDGAIRGDWITSAVHEVTGYEVERSLDQSGKTRIVHPDDSAVFDRRLRRLRSGEDSRDEYRIIRADGEVRWLRAVGRPDIEDGQVVGFFGAARDITLEKQQAEQLEHAQKMDALGQLTGGVAHDFNNLLTVIRGNLELLGDNAAVEGRSRRLLDEALTATRSGAELINSLLTFSRQRPVRPRPVPIGAHLKQQMGLLKRAAGVTVDVTLNLAVPDPVVEVDPSQLDRVALNLVLNSRDAMSEDGAITITVDNVDAPEALSDLASGEYARISVHDNGDGMTDEVASSAAQPFFTTKGPGEGTGMGLSMVYGFTRQFGGGMLIHSEAGVGTRIELYLPAVHSTAPEYPVTLTEGLGHAGNQEHVLVVDDEPSLRLLCTEALSSMGYRVTSVQDAAAARVALLENSDIDLMFTDWVMPGAEDGYQLARWARRRFADLPIIVTTGFSKAREKIAADEFEFEVLEKPYSLPDLARIIHANLAAVHPTQA